MASVNSFAIVSTADRESALTALLESIRTWYPQWNVYLCLQGYSKAFQPSGVTDAMYLDERIGPYMARSAILRKWRSPVWCNLDDDMILTHETQYTLPALWCVKQGMGLVSTNWIKSESNRQRAKFEPVFKMQPIVYTGGGLLYSQAVADLIASKPDKPYLFDNIAWSLHTYTAGYDNLRFLGSLALHKAVSKGGRRAWVGGDNRVLPDADLINLEACRTVYHGTDNNYRIPDSADLTPLAKRLHIDNRIKLFADPIQG